MKGVVVVISGDIGTSYPFNWFLAITKKPIYLSFKCSPFWFVLSFLMNSKFLRQISGRRLLVLHGQRRSIDTIFFIKCVKTTLIWSNLLNFQLKKRGHVYQLVIPCALPHHAGLWEVIARNSAGLVMSGSHIEVRATERWSRAPSSLVPLDRRTRSLSPSALTETSQSRVHSRLDRPHMNEQAPQFTRLFRDQIASCGDNVQFECTVVGLPTPDVSQLPPSTSKPTKCSMFNRVLINDIHLAMSSAFQLWYITKSTQNLVEFLEQLTWFQLLVW